MRWSDISTRPTALGGSRTRSASSGRATIWSAISTMVAVACSTSLSRAERDIDHGAGPVLRQVPGPRDLPVGHPPHLARRVAQAGDPQRHPLDGPRGEAEVDLVADGVLVLQEDEEAGEDVPDQALRTEGQRAAEERDGEHERAEGLVEDLEDGQDRDDPDHAHDGTSNDRAEGLRSAPPRGPDRSRRCRSGPAGRVARFETTRRVTIVRMIAERRITSTLTRSGQPCVESSTRER